MTKIKGSLFGAGAALCLLAAVGGCIVVADDGSSASEEDEIFADEAAAAAAASQMRFGVAPQWSQTWSPPQSGPANVEVVAVGDWLQSGGFTSTHKTKLQQIVNAGKTPYFFGYIATDMTKKGLGSENDCDGNSGAPLCQKGAAYVRANIASMASAYQKAAAGIGAALGGREALIHIEPDWYQFSQTAQQNALTETESDSFINQILGAIKSGCPSCKVVIDFSPWFSPSATKWASSVGDFYDGWDRSVVKYVGLTGKQFPFTTGKIDNFTYKEITTAVSLPLVIVDAYTFGGGPINVDSTWLNESNVAKAVDMGVAIVMLSQTGDVAGYDSFIARVKGSSSSSSSSSTSSSSSSSSSSTSGSGGGGGGTTTSSSSSSSSSTGGGGSGGGNPGTGVRVEGGNITVSITPNSTWTGGYCNNIKLTKTDSGETTWKLYVPSNGATLRDFWNTNAVKQGTDFVFTGVSWNAKIKPGTNVEFGYCANGTR
ncbi:cellulose binding domain-containing protein [Sorangium atrum]|uniref:Cellulose binding domain-containing protein n=1 Tax=Sorangium atrum TaxID=2995308 RepID=A0ABT5C087_9BACT|nr:cellulose binding domain-containing protein [Sorangium aterium]MDC0679255.1 cellulose binding domain-containing protein [Sorangium aterium]